jgi:hypothetical protein
LTDASFPKSRYMVFFREKTFQDLIFHCYLQLKIIQKIDMYVIYMCVTLIESMKENAKFFRYPSYLELGRPGGTQL